MFSKFLCKFPVDLEWAHSCVYRFIVVLNQGIRANLSNCTSKKADKAASKTIDMVHLRKWEKYGKGSRQRDTLESWVTTWEWRELLLFCEKFKKTMKCFGFFFSSSFAVTVNALDVWLCHTWFQKSRSEGLDKAVGTIKSFI